MRFETYPFPLMQLMVCLREIWCFTGPGRLDTAEVSPLPPAPWAPWLLVARFSKKDGLTTRAMHAAMWTLGPLGRAHACRKWAPCDAKARTNPIYPRVERRLTGIFPLVFSKLASQIFYHALSGARNEATNQTRPHWRS